MTKREAAIVSAYTGYVLGEFRETHRYVEEMLGRPVRTHEFADKTMKAVIKSASLGDFKCLEVADV